MYAKIVNKENIKFRRFNVRKTFLRTLCLILSLILFLPVFVSCGTDNVYELGPYSINEEEYAYLLSTYKRRVIESIGLDESYMDAPVTDNDTMTYGEYIEKMYRSDFEQSVYSLLYAQALFDEYGLSLTKEQEDSIKRLGDTVVGTIGNGSSARFDDYVSSYGFTHDAIYSVYEKQAKESVVISYLFGDNYSKLTDEAKEEYFQENYIHFQVLVVNTLYFKDSNGNFANLDESERQAQIQLENELIQLFIGPEDPSFQFKILPAILKEKGINKDVREVTYEELWSISLINDDMEYAGGWYMTKPNAYQLTQKTTLSQAMLTMENDISAIAAKRYFDGDGYIKTENGSEEVKKGDYFEYGTAFIKRLPMEAGAWKKAENKDFFEDSSFIAGVASSSLLSTLKKYSQLSEYTLMQNAELIVEFSLATTPANYIDYDYFHPTEEDDKK